MDGSIHRLTTKQYARIAALIVLGAAIAWSIVNRDRFEVDALVAWIAGFGLMAPLAFCALRVFGAVVLVPGSIMALAAGVMFGVAAGATYNLVASTAGAVLAFAIARYIAPGWIGGKLTCEAVECTRAHW